VDKPLIVSNPAISPKHGGGCRLGKRGGPSFLRMEKEKEE